MKLMGYRRQDGSVGIRNHVLILPCSLCASETARFAAGLVPGAVYLPNQGGCGLSKRDLEMTLEVFSGLAANPNVYGTVLIGNHCETVQAELLAERIRQKTDKPLEMVIIRAAGGAIRAAEQAARLASQMVRDAGQVEKTPFALSELILATECGGSDPTSGLAANPVLGHVSDRVVEAGGTVILSETSELVGTESILAPRCKDEATAQKLLAIIQDNEAHFRRAGDDLRSGNPAPGNIKGGITTIEEKSLGCIHKAGTSTIQAVYGYGEQVREKGLVVMDTPGQDIASVVAMAAGGAQIVLFTTGCGTPTGNALVPVLKLTANAETARLMADHIDFDASAVITDGKPISAVGEELFEQMLHVVCGKQTKAESLGFCETSLARMCNFT